MTIPHSDSTMMEYVPWFYNDTGTVQWFELYNRAQTEVLYRTQSVACSYPVSGGYGPTPRYIFYLLALVSIFARKTSWSVPVALASVVLYSTTAAIHALILAIIRHQMLPKNVTGPNYQIVLAAGHGYPPHYDVDSSDSGTWLPVWPMAWDQDCDPVLAIVGTAFLLLLPMQIWSTTFHKAQPAQKAMMFIWALVLLSGLICALVNEAYVDMNSLPQLRFCPPDQEDILPMSNSGGKSIAGAWDGRDWYQWNRTIRDYFAYDNLTRQPSNICLYPCFDARWPLRDPPDILVYPSTSDNTEVFERLLIAVYILVGLSGCASLTVLVLRHLASASGLSIADEWKDFRLTFAYGKSKVAMVYLRHNLISASAWMIFLIRLWILTIMVYAFVFNPIALVFMVAFTEWLMWGGDPGGESFRHIGQWGVLVATLVVFAAAVLPKMFSSLKEKKESSSSVLSKKTIP